MEQNGKLQAEIQPTKEEILEKLKKENKDGDERERNNMRKAEKFYALGTAIGLLAMLIIGVVFDNEIILLSSVLVVLMGTCAKCIAEYYYKKSKCKLINLLAFTALVVTDLVLFILNLCGVVGSK